MQRVALADLSNLAQRVVRSLDAVRDKSRATLIALRGNLGAGKTTFVQALAKELGVQETVQSPTYVLMKRYDISHRSYTQLIHIDAYRLQNAEEFKALLPAQAGRPSFLYDPSALVVVEWPERIEGALPTPDLVLTFSSDPPAGEAGNVGPEERYIEGV